MASFNLIAGLALIITDSMLPGVTPQLQNGDALFDVGGVIVTDLRDPLSTGLEGVSVTVAGDEGTFVAVSANTIDGVPFPVGIWQIAVPAGTYTVTPSLEGYCFEHATFGVLDGQDFAAIVVDEEHEHQIQNIQFEARSTGPCDDGDLCTTEDTCVGGACAGTPVDCSQLDERCTLGVCNSETGLC